MSRTFLLKPNIVIRSGATPVANENVILDLVAKTIKVTAEMDMQAFYSKLQDYWHATAGLAGLTFPFNPIDNISAKYELGYDGISYNGWAFYDDASKRNLKSAGFRIYNSNGTVAEEWFGVISTVGGIADTDQPYYLLAATDSPTNFAFAGPVNEPVKVYGDATHGSFDKRTFFKMFVREQGKEYAVAQLADVARTSTGPYAQAFGLKNTTDLKVTHSDAVVNAAPYTSLTITYYGADQQRSIGGTNYNFRKIIDNSTAKLTRYQIYERMQYLMRQAADIDGAGGTASGKVADQVCYFVGETLYSTAFIDGLLAADLNSVVFIDQGGSNRTFPFSATGTFNFNSLLQGAANAKYTLYFKSVGGGFDSTTALIVKDKDGVDITGSITGRASIDFSFDYDGNVQGGRVAANPAVVELVVTAPGVAKYNRTEFTITRINGITVAVAGVADPVYQ
jgi:hypothetical protein